MERSRRPVEEVFWQVLLVCNGIGSEALLAVLFVLMVANLRTLGVPVAYTSTPSVLGACMSSSLIVILSFVNEKYATTKVRKACVLFTANLFQCTGAIMIITGNIIFLHFDDVNRAFNSSELMELTVESTSTSSGEPNMNPFEVFNSTATIRYDVDQQLECSSPLCHSDSSSFSPTVSSVPWLPFPLSAGIVMFGYSLLDCGYDPINCCLKTFALACTNSDTHSAVLVKAAAINSFGGVLITLLTSSGMAIWLTADNASNTNPVETVLVAGLALSVELVSLAVTVATGLIRFSDHCQEYKSGNKENKRVGGNGDGEKKELLADYRQSQNREALFNSSVQVTESPLEGSSSGKRSDLSPLRSGAKMHYKVKSCVIFIKESNFRIPLWTGMFFSCFAFFVFDIYSVNFVGVALYHGDPSAPSGSQQQLNFLEGEKAGSMGLLVFYIGCMVAGFIKNWTTRRIGWWREMATVSMLYAVSNFACAVFLEQWLFFVTACLNGFLRLCLYTFPYILLNNAPNPKQKGDAVKSRRTNLDFAVTTAIFAVSFLAASSVSGPLLSATGNASTTVYLQGGGAAVALLFFWCIRKY